MGKKLVRISRVRDYQEIPFSPATLYLWHSTGKYPKIFVRLGRGLFVDLDKLSQIIEDGRGA